MIDGLVTYQVTDAVGVLWDYHRLGETLAPADGILVFGSNDLRVAEHAASLFHAGLSSWILFSGARGRMTQHWPETEAAAMARVAREAGVPESTILIEDRATNTGENIRFAQELLAAAGHAPVSAIVVQKPYMERRTRAALRRPVAAARGPDVLATAGLRGLLWRRSHSRSDDRRDGRGFSTDSGLPGTRVCQQATGFQLGPRGV